MGKIATHKDLRVFQNSFKVSMEIYVLTKSFPKKKPTLLQIKLGEAPVLCVVI